MPMIDGKYVPRPERRLQGTLFGVLPPGHPEEAAPATDEERLWYEHLVDHVTKIVVFVVANVRHNYDTSKGVRFDGRIQGEMNKRSSVVSELLEGEPSWRGVTRVIGTLVKQLGLVVHDPAPGPRHNWPMPARWVTAKEAERLVRDAFWGQYPEPPQGTPADVPPGFAQVTRLDD